MTFTYRRGIIPFSFSLLASWAIIPTEAFAADTLYTELGYTDKILGDSEMNFIVLNGDTTLPSELYDKIEKLYFTGGSYSYVKEALAKFPNIKELKIPGSVEIVDKELFSSYRSLFTNQNLPLLKKIIFDEGLKEIRSDYLNDNLPFEVSSDFCSYFNIKEVILPKDLTTIPSGLFSSLHGLKEVIIPYGVTNLTIDNNAFNSSGLPSIKIPESVTKLTINDLAFYGCSRLTLVEIPNSVTNLKIGNSAFDGCISLKSLIIPNSVTNLIIGEETFYGCESLTSLEIPDSVTNLEINNTFKECTNLTSLTIPNSVESLTNVCNFYGGNLTTILGTTIPNSVVEWTFKICNPQTVSAINKILNKDPYSIAPFSASCTLDISASIVSLDALIGNAFWKLKLNDSERYEWNDSKWVLING
ncbi:MAG: leucine-rich repeat domain-containing protein [Holosporales bacterium]|nr:leucine-rich repeat domain-containing protein [Holosporales bacterium]